VKIAELPSGGIGAFVYEFATGTLVRDDSYLSRVLEHGRDIDSFSEAEFDAAVAALRRQYPPQSPFRDRAITWKHTGDGELPYRAQVEGRALAIRINDFPAEPLYTLIIDGEEIADLDDWPTRWVRPDIPPAPRALAGKKRR
jgi:hypothetical protein